MKSNKGPNEAINLVSMNKDCQRAGEWRQIEQEEERMKGKIPSYPTFRHILYKDSEIRPERIITIRMEVQFSVEESVISNSK